MNDQVRIPIGVCPFGCLHYSDEIEEIIGYRTVIVFGEERNVMDARIKGAQLPMTFNLDIDACRYGLNSETLAWLAEAEADADDWNDEQQTRESVFPY